MLSLLLLAHAQTQTPPPPPTIGEVAKISQVTGETDRQRGVPTDNQTETRFGLRGIDLGASFEHKGKLVFLFGDTWPTGPNTPDRPIDGDAIAFSSDKNPDDGLRLDFLTAPDGKYKAVHIPGVSLAGFEVPNGGFSDGKYMYGFYTTDHSRVDAGEIMGRCVLARSEDGLNWSQVYSLSSDKFINVAPVVADAAKTPGLPVKKGKVLLMWAGSREYRRSSPYMAYVPLDKVTDKSAIRYWTGPDRWSENEADAKPVVEHPHVGEISVDYCAPLKKWIMMYNCGAPRGINIRVADRPTGPWSESKVLFDPHKLGYGKFMHISWQDRKVDNVQDPGRENEYGGEYGPYIISKFTKKTKDGARIYFLMSVWNPYAVVLMRADISDK